MVYVPTTTKLPHWLTCPLPRDIKQLRSLLGGLSYYRKFLPNMAKRVKSITSLLKREPCSTSRPLWRRPFAPLSQNSQHHQYFISDWALLLTSPRPFRLHCDASTDGLGPTLEQEQPDDSIRPIVYVSRATLSSERNWTPWNSRPGCVVWEYSSAYAVTYLAFYF